MSHARSRPSAEPVSVAVPNLILSDLVRRPIPKSARGAILHSVPLLLTEPIRAAWAPAQNPNRLRPGSILLDWAPSLDGSMDVTARLGLASAEVVLATWPGLRGDWTPIVHPTLYEVIGLHAALSVAVDALHLANHLASA